MGTSPAGASGSDLSNRSRIMNRIERDTGVPHLADILSDRLAPTDLQSLLLEVYARRVKRRDPKALLDDHVSNRFAQPSASNPGRLLEWDRVAFSKLPKVFRPVDLSPVCLWEPPPFYLQSVRIGSFRRSEIPRLSRTRQMCSRLNVRLDAASRRTSPLVMRIRYISQQVTAF